MSTIDLSAGRVTQVMFIKKKEDPLCQ
jgi:hypothetical protein